jgi:hypothetical protein
MESKEKGTGLRPFPSAEWRPRLINITNITQTPNAVKKEMSGERGTCTPSASRQTHRLSDAAGHSTGSLSDALASPLGAILGSITHSTNREVSL